MKKQVQTTSRDAVTSYARKVLSGNIIAGPYVRDACTRHLRDLEQAPERGFFFDLEKANRALGFFKDVLKLNGGQFEGKPYVLLPWQSFIIGSLFGWVDAQGMRRFRIAYIETAKGSGKSPLAAGIGLYGLVADGEARAEVYAAATKKDQAMVLFRDAVAMVDQSPILRAALAKSGIGASTWNLAYHKAGSFFRPISADDGQSGPRPHIVLLDEIHEHKTANVVEMLRAGTKSRQQALIVMITNSGHDKQTVCWNYHEASIHVNQALTEQDKYFNDQFFGYVCALDAGEDPIKDEACWAKANPSLQDGIPGFKYLREQVTEARGMPSKESLVRRLNFCEWTEAESPWISSQAWFDCQEKEFDYDLLYDRRCYAGLDLSSTQDLTALVLLFEPCNHDKHWRLVPYFWLPGDGLHEKSDKDRVPYIAWRDAGYLEALPGRAINKLAVLKRTVEICSMYDVQSIGFDRWRIEDFKMLMDQEGASLPLSPFGQGFKDMAPAVDTFESMIIDKTLRHNGNPVMTWCAANAIIATDPAGNRKVTKEKATGRVDGIVAAIMAAGKINNEVVIEATKIKQGFVAL